MWEEVEVLLDRAWLRQNRVLGSEGGPGHCWG